MKKKLLTVLIMIGCSFSLFSQISEPEFIGEAFIIKENSTTPIILEKSVAQIKQKAKASLYLVGVGKVRSRIHIENAKSNIRINKNQPFTIIIRGVDNNSDPLSIISIFQFETTSKERRAELSSVGTFQGSSSNNLNFVKFTGKKYGGSSYELSLSTLEAGEYGVLVRNPNVVDEKTIVVVSFGVDN